jgi:hypothetical protein
VRARLIASNPLQHPEKIAVTLLGRGLAGDQGWKIEIPAGSSVQRDVTLTLRPDIEPGRHIFPLRISGSRGADAADAFLGVDIEP